MVIYKRFVLCRILLKRTKGIEFQMRNRCTKTNMSLVINGDE